MDRELEQRLILDGLVRTFCASYAGPFVSRKSKTGTWTPGSMPQGQYLTLKFTNTTFGDLSIHQFYPSGLLWRWFSGPPVEWVWSSEGRQDEQRIRSRHNKSGAIPGGLFDPMADTLFRAMRNYLQYANMPIPPLFSTVR